MGGRARSTRCSTGGPIISPPTGSRSTPAACGAPPASRVSRPSLGLRTADGVPASWLESRLDGDERLRRRVDTWRAQALLAGADDRVRLTEAGFLLSDALFVDLL